MNKKLFQLFALIFLCNAAIAQDSTIAKADTIRVGNILIIKKKHSNDDKARRDSVRIVKKNKNVTTNYLGFDFGFSNFNDKTNYSATNDYFLTAPGSPAFSSNDVKLRAGKSINLNIWLFMQKRNLIKNNLSLVYGLGLELNNYRYKTNISYKEGINSGGAYIFRDSISFTKNKFATDYLTVPIMLNISSNKTEKNKSINIGFGVSAGYLYSQRNKQISHERGKQTNKGEYDLRRFKISYISEIGLGSVKLYGSYSPTSIYKIGLDMRPYTIGIRVLTL